jgi:hypothetical protein
MYPAETLNVMVHGITFKVNLLVILWLYKKHINYLLLQDTLNPSRDNDRYDGLITEIVNI